MENLQQTSPLLQIFPAEIWLKIFNHARDHDVHKAYLSSPAFEGLLRPLRIQFLFPAAFKILLDDLPKEKAKTKIALQCRAVCSHWKVCVDQILQDDTIPIQLEDNKYTIEQIKPFGIHTNFYDLEEVVKFESKFQSSHLDNGINPFPGRAIKIFFRWLPSREPEREYLLQLEQLLTRVGHHVWFCYLCVWQLEDVTDFSECARFLELLPNLKMLKIDHLQDKIEMIPPERLSVFPKLEHFKCLKVMRQGAENLLEAVVTHNPQISVISTENCYVRERSALFTREMSNLAEVKISLKTPLDLQQLGNAQVNSPLTKLILHLNRIEKAVHWKNMGAVYKNLENKFANTLKELHISYPPRLYHTPTPYTLNLPNLETLSLDMELSHPISLDFILPMKDTLQVLEVWYSFNPGPNFKEETVRFFKVGIHEKLANSNIWDLFPKLKEVNIYQQKGGGTRRNNYRRGRRGVILSVKNFKINWMTTDD